MKTALQELIETYERKRDHVHAMLNGLPTTHQDVPRLKAKYHCYKSMVTDLERGLPMEKKNLKDAWMDADANRLRDEDKQGNFDSYYEKEYE